MKSISCTIIFISLLIGIIFLSPLFVSAQTPTTPLDTQALIKQLQALVQSLQSQINELKIKLETTQQELAVVKSEIQFNSFLSHGSTGDEVTQLQEFLSKDPGIYPEGLVTGYFGPLTQRAVIRFQQKHNIESLGIVGPRTRAKLQELVTLGAGASGIIPPGFLIAPGISAATQATTTPAGKIIICHYPPGNPENKQTLEIDESALGAHLVHGDTQGACTSIPPSQVPPSTLPPPSSGTTTPPTIPPPAPPATTTPPTTATTTPPTAPPATTPPSPTPTPGPTPPTTTPPPPSPTPSPTPSTTPPSSTTSTTTTATSTSSGSLNVSIAGVPSAQSVERGTTGFLFSKVQYDANVSGEDLKITMQQLTITTSASADADDLNNCFLYDGPTKLNSLNPVNPAGNSAGTDVEVSFLYDTPLIISRGTTKTIEVKCNILSSAVLNERWSIGIADTNDDTAVVGKDTLTVVAETVTVNIGPSMTVSATSTPPPPPTSAVVPTITEIATITGFNHPTGIGINPKNGNIYVADYHNDKVKVFNSSFSLIQTLGNTRGSGNGQFSEPWDIAFDSLGNAFISDTNNARIQVFDTNGTFLYAFSAGQAYQGLATNSIGDIYGSGREVKVFDTQGNVKSTWSLANNYYPRNIAIDKNNRVYLSNWGNSIFSPPSYTYDSNNYITVQDASGGLNSKISLNYQPYFVEVDSLSRIWVADHTNGKIQVYDSAGAFITSFSLPFSACNLCGSDYLSVNSHNPVGLEIEGNKLYVSVYYANIVRVYSIGPEGTLAAAENKENVVSLSTSAELHTIKQMASLLKSLAALLGELSKVR